MGDDTSANAIRIGNAEREAAMKGLDEHLEAGRLDPEEYGERYAKASMARTEDELRPLFVDLPGPFSPTGSRWAPPQAHRAATSPEPHRANRPPGTGRTASSGPSGAPLFGKLGERFVALSPFIALALFFVAGLPWVVFLIIPASGALVYGSMRGARGQRGRSRCHPGWR